MTATLTMLHLTRRERRGESASPDAVYRDCNRCVPCAGSLYWVVGGFGQS